MESKQFAWTYMVLHGMANLTPGRYGGYDPVDQNVKTTGTSRHNQYNDTFIQMIKDVGVDWDKTQAPKSDYDFEFNGTDCDSSKVEFMSGKLVLKNGYEQHWMANHDLGDLSRNVFDMMAKIDELKAKYIELFGEQQSNQ